MPNYNDHIPLFSLVPHEKILAHLVSNPSIQNCNEDLPTQKYNVSLSTCRKENTSKFLEKVNVNGLREAFNTDFPFFLYTFNTYKFILSLILVDALFCN